MDKIIEPLPIPMPEPKKDNILQSGEELRIYKIEDHLKVLLVDGKAEVFGRELPLKMPVYFHQGEKIAIYTYHGARVLVSGRCEMYISQ
jgi:polyribonucleotide 5'-hydroxyl-kinase